MHWPHLRQRSKKRVSSKAPGGRTSRGCQFVPSNPLNRIIGTAVTPATAEIMKPRREISGDGNSPAADRAVL